MGGNVLRKKHRLDEFQMYRKFEVQYIHRASNGHCRNALDRNEHDHSEELQKQYIPEVLSTRAKPADLACFSARTHVPDETPAVLGTL